MSSSRSSSIPRNVKEMKIFSWHVGILAFWHFGILAFWFPFINYNKPLSIGLPELSEPILMDAF